MAQPSDADIQVASRILQACIVAIPFWLTANRYWIDNLISDDDINNDRFDFMTAFIYGGNAAGLFALVLAINFSSDVLTAASSDQLDPILDLVVLFTLVSFGILLSSVADHLSETPGTFLFYNLTAILVGGIIVIGYLWNYVYGLISLAIVFVLGRRLESHYNYVIRKWKSRNGEDSFYRDIGIDVALKVASLTGRDSDLSGVDEESLKNRLVPLMGEEDAEHYLNVLRNRERKRLVQEGMNWLSDEDKTAQMAEEIRRKQRLSDAGDGLDWLLEYK